MEAFVAALANWLKMLGAFDSAISGIAKGSLDWVVSDLAMGSLRVQAEARSRLEDKNYGPDVVSVSITGLRVLEYEGRTPPYLSEVGLKSATRLLKLIGNEGVTGIRMANHTESVELSARASAHVDQLLPIRRHALGSVEGKLELISVHGPKPRFNVYQRGTHKAVSCVFPETMLNESIEALGRRVIAIGVVYYNAKNEPVRLVVERLRVLRRESELPSIEAIGGSDPDFTGGVSTAEYLRSMRNG